MPRTWRERVEVVRGEGIVFLLAGTVVTLRNLTTSRVVCSAIVPGGGTATNRTLSLKKLSA